MATAFAGQTILITGASRGIGLALARHFLGAGATVVGVSRSAGEDLGQGYHHVRADVTDSAAAAGAIRTAFRLRNRLDGVINNAGGASMNLALFTPDRTIDRLFAVNFRSTVVVSREAVRYMQRRRYGRIVNFTSVAVPLRLEGESIYAAMKSANEAFTRALAREVASFGITVNAVGPGPVDTDLIRGVPAEKIRRVLDALALPRLTEVREVAYAVEMFLRPEATALTGQVVYLGGAG